MLKVFLNLDYGSNINLQLTNALGIQTTMLSCAKSGVSLNGSLIGRLVPPIMQYVNLPAISSRIGSKILINGNNPSTLTTTETATFTSKWWFDISRECLCNNTFRSNSRIYKLQCSRIINNNNKIFIWL